MIGDEDAVVKLAFTWCRPCKGLFASLWEVCQDLSQDAFLEDCGQWKWILQALCQGSVACPWPANGTCFCELDVGRWSRCFWNLAISNQCWALTCSYGLYKSAWNCRDCGIKRPRIPSLRPPAMFSNFVCPQGQDISDVRSLQRGQVGKNLARCKQQAFRDKHGGGHGADVEKNEWMIIVTRVLFKTSRKIKFMTFDGLFKKPFYERKSEVCSNAWSLQFVP